MQQKHLKNYQKFSQWKQHLVHHKKRTISHQKRCQRSGPPPLIARRTMCSKCLSDFAENIMTYGDNQKIYTVCYKNIEKDLTRRKKSPQQFHKKLSNSV